MNSDRSTRAWAGGGLLLTGLLISIGSAWAFERGGQDFNVFYQAWSYVLSGRGGEIYFYTPDRFLYAPGFAFLFSPLALLPRGAALLLWCFLKAAALGALFGALGADLADEARGDSGQPAWVSAGLAAWAGVFWGKAILIDLQYGQVNVFILAACFWALRCHVLRRGPRESAWAWACAAIAAATKVFPLPLLIVPWLSLPGADGKGEGARAERIGSLAGILFYLLLPFLFRGVRGGISLYANWREELLSKGLPLESHNQSFLAFLHHFFSGDSTHVISQGPQGWFHFGTPALSAFALSSLGWAWLFAAFGVLFTVLLRGPRVPGMKFGWIALATGLLIVPSHLVWKTYFLFGIPAAALVLSRARKATSPALPLALLTLFALINFSGFDFLGAEWGARLEAASILLACHLILLGIIAWIRMSGEAQAT